MTGSFHLDDYSLFSQGLWRPLYIRPVTYFTFWLNEAIGGRNPVGYHAVNLGLHIAAVLLLYRALRGPLSQEVAFAAAAIFAVHPFQAEPVNYVFERSILLATVFCLASLGAWTQGRAWMAVAWFAAGLLSKEECVAFPLFLGLLHLSGKREPRERAPLVAMLVLSALAGVWVMLAGAAVKGSGIGGQAAVTPVQYLLAQGIVILRYLRMLVLPWGFTVDPDIPIPSAAVGVIGWAGVGALVVVAARRLVLGRAGTWFLGGLLLLLPSSSIFPASDLAADRRMYLPMIAFAVGIAVAAYEIRVAPLVRTIALVLLIMVSFSRTLVWHTEGSLWSDAVDHAPRKIRPKIQLARAVDPERALSILKEAEALAPDDQDVPAEEGRVWLELGNPPQALAAFGRALALAPSSALAHNNRGVALLALGQKDAARADFERAFALDPCLFDARLNLLRLGVAKPTSGACRFSAEQMSALTAAN